MKYLAEDGTVFSNEEICRKYEATNIFCEQKRVNKLAEELKNWLKNNNVEIGYSSINDGDETNDVYLYSTNNENIESISLWDDD